LDFSIFKPKKIRPEKFRTNFFYDFQISRQKRSGRTNFQTKNFWLERISNRTSGKRSGRKILGQIARFIGSTSKKGVFPMFAEIVRDFFRAKVCTPHNFVARNVLYREKFGCRAGFGEVFLESPLLFSICACTGTRVRFRQLSFDWVR
jgi:hypothetical protein